MGCEALRYIQRTAGKAAILEGLRAADKRRVR